MGEQTQHGLLVKDARFCGVLARRCEDEASVVARAIWQ